MSRSIDIEIATSNKGITWDIIDPDDSRLSTGDSTEITEDAEVVYQGIQIQRGFDIPSVVQLTLDMGHDVTVGVVSAWLYDKLKDEDVSLSLGGEQVAVQKERIQERLEELRR